ncbi:MAG: hypothetical protein DSZ35_09370 [Verrucomicrobia bacterium]|nr:MAG: hypothetical protein DSZ35_09370 [Verrucomicrobiota bacterium]
MKKILIKTIAAVLCFTAIPSGFSQSFDFDLDSSDWFKPTGIWKYAEAGNLAKVQKQLDKGVDVNDEFNPFNLDLPGTTPLGFASGNGHVEVMALLIDSGADIEKYGERSLKLAAAGGHLDAVKLLVSQGVDVVAHGGEAALLAAVNRHYETLKYFVDLDTGVDAINEIHAFYEKFIDGDEEIVIQLLWPLGSLDGVLTRAVEAEREDLSILIIKIGGDVNVRGEAGWTHLHTAVYHKLTKMVEFLISTGVDVSVETDYGQSVLFFARSRGVPEIITMIEKAAPPVMKIRRGEGQLTVEIEGLVGERYEVSYSPNLREWETREIVKLESPTRSYAVQKDLEQPMGFYRVKFAD